MEEEEIRLTLLDQINYKKIAGCIGSNRKGERWEFSLGKISSQRKRITLAIAIMEQKIVKILWISLLFCITLRRQ
jgi:hypothetical protein